MNGKYWDRAWSLVDGCIPCSPGCEHCWSAAMTKRFHNIIPRVGNPYFCLFLSGCGWELTTDGKFNGVIITHPERLSVPLKRKKPTVYAVWNDLFHEAVPFEFWVDAYKTMAFAINHTFLVLTKRPQKMLEWYATCPCPRPNIYHGLTVCNQQEADEKIPVFLLVPGKKFLSLEPLLGPVDFRKVPGFNRIGMDLSDWNVLLGGETGLGARPMHPDWVRSVRDQCAAAGVPFFFKGWGRWGLNWMNDDKGKIEGSEWMDKGIKNAGRLLDGRTHDDLPWRDRP